MKKKLLIWLIIVPLGLGVLLYGFIYIFFGFFYYDPYVFPNSSWQPEEGSFLIDSETILASLNAGNEDVFLPNSVIVEGLLPKEVTWESINWTTRDYLMIAEALNKKVWKDTLNDWKIFYMVFISDCQDIPHGFYEGNIVYFKTDSNRKNYIVREYSILPKYGYVEWGGGATAPRNLFGWKSIDLERMIDADDALGIAEENGGKATRLRFGNNCSIHLRLSPEIYADKWFVWYNVLGSSKFQIFINPLTGKIIRK